MAEGSKGSDQKTTKNVSVEGVTDQVLAAFGLTNPFKGSMMSIDSLLTKGDMALATVNNMANGLANAMESKGAGIETKVAKAVGTKQQGNDGPMV